MKNWTGNFLEKVWESQGKVREFLDRISLATMSRYSRQNMSSVQLRNSSVYATRVFFFFLHLVFFVDRICALVQQRAQRASELAQKPKVSSRDDLDKSFEVDRVITFLK